MSAPVPAVEKLEIKGKFNRWSLNGHSRDYADVHMTFRNACKFIKAERYNALTGRGEQRDRTDTHSRKLKTDMLAGDYTPTQFKANLRKDQRDNLVKDDETREFTLVISSDNPMAQTDGCHREGAVGFISDELLEKLAKAESEKDKAAIEALLAEVDNLEIGVRIYFDGDPQKDFLRLQASRTVDRSHMLSLRIQKGLAGDDSFKLAMAIAKALNKSDGSPFRGLIRFDSKAQAAGSMVKLLPISTLMSKSTSDLGTSLVGLARLGGTAEKDASFLAGCIVTAYLAIDEHAPSLLESEKVLTPARQGGTKASQTMLVGIGMCLAQYMLLKGRDEATAEDIQVFVETAKATLDLPITGNSSSQGKRTLIGAFARTLFAGFEGLHEGVPTSLLTATSCSAFNVEPLPKQKSGKSVVTPDVDGPVPSEAIAEAAAEREVTEEDLAKVAGEDTWDAEPAAAGVGEEIMG